MAAQRKSELKVVFGTMTFGEEGADHARVHDLKDCAKILDVFQGFGHNEIDTARNYGGGSSEQYLSQLDLEGRGLIYSTKLAPDSFNGLTYNHEAKNVRQGLLDSLEALNVKKLKIFYLHKPDHNTPYEETFREVNNLYNEGYFELLGISNYSAWETAQICEMTTRNGWKKPDVYQGIYNALHRGIEAELFPCLHYYGIAFYLFNPLAGGMLTNRYSRQTQEHEQGSRFDPNRSQGKDYRDRYWKTGYFDALEHVRPVADKLNITLSGAALRWCNHHSLLRKEHGDAIIIGASSAEQLRENLENLEKGPLPEELVKAFDEGWAMAKGNCSQYFR